MFTLTRPCGGQVFKVVPYALDMDTRQTRGAHPAGRRTEQFGPASDDPWEMGFSSLFGIENSTFLEDYQGPLAKVTPIRPAAPRRVARLGRAIVRVLSYLGHSLENLPEMYDF